MALVAASAIAGLVGFVAGLLMALAASRGALERAAEREARLRADTLLCLKCFDLGRPTCECD